MVREFDRAGLAPGDVRTQSPLACAIDLIKDNPMFRTWLILTDVLDEPEQAIPDPLRCQIKVLELRDIAMNDVHSLPARAITIVDAAVRHDGFAEGSSWVSGCWRTSQRVRRSDSCLVPDPVFP
jgi:hypothetical protein